VPVIASNIFDRMRGAEYCAQYIQPHTLASRSLLLQTLRSIWIPLSARSSFEDRRERAIKR
jgi:hypothetical protein